MIKGFLSRAWDNSDSRGILILKNIFWSAGLKVVNAAVSFVLIPLYLSLLTEVAFGIWLTVSAVVQWFNFFDLGIGNGLRNRLTEALAEGKYELGRIFVSTTYAVVSMIAFGMLIIFLLVNGLFDWSQVFEAPAHLSEEVNRMVFILFALFIPQFIVQLIKMVVTADQRPALSNLMNTLVNLFQLVGVYLMVQWDYQSLSQLAWLIGGINLLIPALASIFLFAGRYRSLLPRVRDVQFKYTRSLMGLGVTFFILQGAALVVFMTDNLIITKVLGPDEVPAYNISYRYFNLGLVFFGLVTTPFWSAFTDAYVKNDFTWIAKMLNRLLFLWLGLTVLVIAMLLAAPFIYSLWIGSEISIPFLLNASMALWVILSAGLSIYGTFLSGVGKLRLSLYHAVFVMVINIPLSIWLAGFPALGSAGVILASAIGASFRIFFQPFQTYQILRKKAVGIWAR